MSSTREAEAQQNGKQTLVQSSYTEPEPSVREWLSSLVPSPGGIAKYIRSIFLCIEWLPSYNRTWLTGDLIAGLTVGFVVIPQAMAYALLANLSPEYGLYTSFVGAALYWIFGSSKDIVIGTTAVGSLLVGSVIASIQDLRPGVYTNEAIAKTVSALSGLILLGVGLARLGWIVEFIPYIPISAFVTAAAVTIMATQFSTLMGITGVDTRAAPYRVIISSLQGLPRTRVDAAIGLSSLVLLYGIRYLTARLEARSSARKRMWAILSSLRLTFTILLYTFISWLVNRTNTGKSPFRIVGHIERGFQHAGPPPLDQGDLVLLVLPQIPAIIIILVIEHIAIAKSFGRIFGYTIVPSQEVVAQGASNLLGTFVGGYACTGSFGASAVLSKAGVRTPLAGLVSAGILILALYALPAVFFYIPMAALAGLIIHSVANLPTQPRTLYKYWRLSPAEFVVWWIGVLVAIFVSLEISIYVTICVSLALLLMRLARCRGSFLGQAVVRPLALGAPRDREPDSKDGVHLEEPPEEEQDHTGDDPALRPGSKAQVGLIGRNSTDKCSGSGMSGGRRTTTGHDELPPPRSIYLPLDHHDASNPALYITTPHPGVFIYRFPLLLSYLNQAQHMHRLVGYIKTHTRGPSRPADPATRLWSEAATRSHPIQDGSNNQRPCLRAVVLDCTAVDVLDITSVQGLVDARRALDKHACCAGRDRDGGRDRDLRCVQWHFAGVWNPWARRALSVAGFGVRVGPVPSTATAVSGSWADGQDSHSHGHGHGHHHQGEDEAAEGNPLAGWLVSYAHVPVIGEGEGGLVMVRGVDRPYFHLDLAEAVEAAVEEVKRQECQALE